MKVDVAELDKVRKKVEVVLPEDKVSQIRESIFSELRKNAKIKGFRPGKVPRPIIASFYKDYIDDELKKRMVESTMAEALSSAKVSPVTDPLVDFIEEEGKYAYTLECEVLPEVDLPVYTGLEVEVDPIRVTPEELDKRIEGMQQMHAEMVMKEGDTGAEKGDFVVVKYQGYHNGKPIKDVGTEAYPMELGQGNLLPEFENAVFGMKAGEEKEIEVNFPADYPDKNIATKKVLFKVTAREIRQKRLPEVNDEFAKDLNFEDLAALREGLTKEIEKEKESGRKQIISQKIKDALTKDMDIPVPQRLLEKRIEGMLEEAATRFNMERFSEEERSKFVASFRTEFESQARERIKADIVLARISDKEEIKIGDSELEERLRKIADESKRAYEDVRAFYEHYDLMGSLMASLLQEKTVGFLRDSAVIREKE